MRLQPLGKTLKLVASAGAAMVLQCADQGMAYPSRMLQGDRFDLIASIGPPSRQTNYASSNSCNQVVFTSPAGIDYLEFLAVGTSGAPVRTSQASDSIGGRGAVVD